MQPRPYNELSEVEILTLAIWREARNQSLDGQIAAGWSIRNRVDHPGWWNRPAAPFPSLWHATILKPYQYSSFNKGDANSIKWPPDDPTHPEYESGQQAQQAAEAVFLGTVTDPTNGATNYYDTSIEFPKSWGSEADWENTLDIGHFRFWKPVDTEE